VARDRYQRLKAQVTAAQALQGLAATPGLSDELRAHRVIVEWADIVGPRIARVAWPEGLSKGVLWVRVRTSPWLQELTLLKGQLLAQLHAAIGEGGADEAAATRRAPLVTDLRFSLRPKPTEDDDLIARLKKAGLIRVPPPRRRAVPAVGPARAAIEAEADRVDDPELREVIKAVRVRNGR
jgi:hypothetical protein